MRGLSYADKSNQFTAPFNNTRTIKFIAQPTNAFFATVNQMFGGSSQLLTTAERAVIKPLCTTKQCSAVVVSWEDTLNVWLTAAKNAFVSRPFHFKVPMLLKSAVRNTLTFKLLRSKDIWTLQQMPRLLKMFSLTKSLYFFWQGCFFFPWQNGAISFLFGLGFFRFLYPRTFFCFWFFHKS